MLYPAPARWHLGLSGLLTLLALGYYLLVEGQSATTFSVPLTLVLVAVAFLITHLVERVTFQAKLLRLQSSEMEALLERLGDFALLIGPAGQVEFMTKAASDYGFQPDRVKGSPWTELFEPAERQVISELIVAAMAAETGVSGPTCSRIQLPRGDSRFFDATVCPTHTGPAGQLLVLFRDVTERRHLEESMARMDRLAAVAHLSAGVAHNFNNILAGIMLNAGLVARATDPHEQQKLIDRVLSAAERGASLCRSLLTFSRGETPSLGLVPVGPILTDLSALFESEAHRKGIALSWQVPDSLQVYGDRSQIQQVLLNFLFNARDAVGTNGGWIRISGSSEGERVRIAVTNSGQPIPREHLPLLFLPFFTTRGDVMHGTGLGLPVCQGLAEGMNGSIEVESGPGEETTFSLLLPIAPVAPVNKREDLHANTNR